MLENCWREHISGSLEKFFEIYYVSILNYLFFFICIIVFSTLFIQNKVELWLIWQRDWLIWFDLKGFQTQRKSKKKSTANLLLDTSYQLY